MEEHKDEKTKENEEKKEVHHSEHKPHEEKKETHHEHKPVHHVEHKSEHHEHKEIYHSGEHIAHHNPEHHTTHHTEHHLKPIHHAIHQPTHKKDEFQISKTIGIMIGVLALLLIVNQFQILGINGNNGGGSVTGFSVKTMEVSAIGDITTTSQAVAMLFPIEDINSEQDAMDMMIAQGTPDYGDAMGISFDDPVGALELLASNYNTVKSDIKENYPEVWERYLNLATKPVGISCEFCCGIGPIGINKKGDITCGCSHNPAIQSLTMLLMKDTNMDDTEVLREDMRWKSLWYPRDMVGLALKASGGEIETALPGMVGGC